MNLAQVPPAVFLNGVAQLLQTLTGRHGHLPLVMPDEQCLGQLVVKAQSVDRFLQGQSVLAVRQGLTTRVGRVIARHRLQIFSMLIPIAIATASSSPTAAFTDS